MSVLDDDQLALQQGARGLLSSRHPIAVVRAGAGTELGCSPELWREIGAAGWPGIIHGEATGGAGGGLLDLVAVT
ncbi:MAG: acyl-CoA dehydrogenase family protein, partial [Ilumatobacteraceae bacterium]